MIEFYFIAETLKIRVEIKKWLIHIICWNKSFSLEFDLHMLWHFLFESLLSSNLILESHAQNISHLIHLQLHKTYSLFYSFRMVFLWHMIPASLTPKLFQRSKHKKRIKKKTSKESRKILEYEMMNNKNSSPFILGYILRTKSMA